MILKYSGVSVFQKGIAFLTAVVFSVSTLQAAAPLSFPVDQGGELDSAVFDAGTLSEQIVIPDEIGHVRDRFCPREAVPERLVVHIQDAHCNFEAQAHIRKILEELVFRYGIDFVALEGARGPIDLERFARMESDRVPESLLKKWMRKGILTGAETMGIDKASTRAFSLYGIEDTRPYLENFAAYRAVMGEYRNTRDFSRALGSLLDKLQSRIYSPELIEFSERRRKFDDDRIKMTEYVLELATLCSRGSGDDVSLLLAPGTPYPDFRKTVEATRFEKSIDLEQIKVERNLLTQTAREKLDAASLTEFITLQESFRKELLTVFQYYTALEPWLDLLEAGGDEPPFVNIRKYIDLIDRYRDINTTRLFEEFDEIEYRIQAHLCETEEQKRLVRLERECRILQKILSLEVTRGEYDYFRDNRERFSVKPLLEWPRKKADAYGIHWIPLLDRDHYPVEYALKNVERFYSAAFERDRVLVENLLEKMDRDGRSLGVMITGGFHSKAITERLARKNIAYLVVSPKLSKTEAPELYQRLMMGGNIEVERVLASLHSGLAPPLLLESGLALRPRRQLDLLLEELESALHSGAALSIPRLDEALDRLEVDRNGIVSGLSDSRRRALLERIESISGRNPNASPDLSRLFERLESMLGGNEDSREDAAREDRFFDMQNLSRGLAVHVRNHPVLGELAGEAALETLAEFLRSTELDVRSPSELDSILGEGQRFLWGGVQADASGNFRLFLEDSYLEELETVSKNLHLSPEQAQDYLLATALEHLTGHAAFARTDAYAALILALKKAAEIFPSRDNFPEKPEKLDPREVTDYLSRILTGDEEYVFFRPQGPWEGRIINFMRNMARKIKDLIGQRRHVMVKQASGLYVFQEHLELKKRILINQKKTRLNDMERRILDDLFFSQNPELREMAVKAMIHNPNRGYEQLERQSERASKLYFGWLKFRRAALLLFGVAGITGLTVFFLSSVITVGGVPLFMLIPSVADIVFYPSIYSIFVWYGTFLSLVSNMDSWLLPAYQQIKEINLLLSLARPDYFRNLVESPGAMAPEFERFDDPAYQHVRDGEQTWRNEGEYLYRQVLDNLFLPYSLVEKKKKRVRPSFLLEQAMQNDESGLLKKIFDAQGKDIARDEFIRALRILRSQVDVDFAEKALAISKERRKKTDEDITVTPGESIVHMRELREALDEIAGKIQTGQTFTKNQVRVKIWERDPWNDLSNSRELYACCFLGGLADVDIFNFIRHGSLTMMDFYSKAGLRSRVMMAAAHEEVDGARRPVLLVFDVEGRQQGLFGPEEKDNAFIQDEIEAYARHLGIEHIVYNGFVHNQKPVSFIKYISENRGEPVEKIQVSLAAGEEELNLETFGYPRNFLKRAAYVSLGLIRSEAIRGKMSGFRVRVAPLEKTPEQQAPETRPAEALTLMDEAERFVSFLAEGRGFPETVPDDLEGLFRDRSDFVKHVLKRLIDENYRGDPEAERDTLDAIIDILSAKVSESARPAKKPGALFGIQWDGGIMGEIAKAGVDNPGRFGFVMGLLNGFFSPREGKSSNLLFYSWVLEGILAENGVGKSVEETKNIAEEAAQNFIETVSKSDAPQSGARKGIFDSPPGWTEAETEMLAGHAREHGRVSPVPETLVQNVGTDFGDFLLVPYDRDDPAGRIALEKNAGGAFHMPGRDMPVIFLERGLEGTEYLEALEHELLEIRWMREGLKAEDAHTLAWADQISLHGWNRIQDSSFIGGQLRENRDLSRLLKLLRENREDHPSRALIRDRLERIRPGAMETVETFERAVKRSAAESVLALLEPGRDFGDPIARDLVETVVDILEAKSDAIDYGPLFRALILDEFRPDLALKIARSVARTDSRFGLDLESTLADGLIATLYGEMIRDDGSGERETDSTERITGILQWFGMPEYQAKGVFDFLDSLMEGREEPERVPELDEKSAYLLSLLGNELKTMKVFSEGGITSSTWNRMRAQVLDAVSEHYGIEQGSRRLERIFDDEYPVFTGDEEAFRSEYPELYRLKSGFEFAIEMLKQLPRDAVFTDYVLENGQVRFARGEETKELSLFDLSDTSMLEQWKAFHAKLNYPVNAATVVLLASMIADRETTRAARDIFEALERKTVDREPVSRDLYLDVATLLMGNDDHVNAWLSLLDREEMNGRFFLVGADRDFSELQSRVERIESPYRDLLRRRLADVRKPRVSRGRAGAMFLTYRPPEDAFAAKGVFLLNPLKAPGASLWVALDFAFDRYESLDRMIEHSGGENRRSLQRLKETLDRFDAGRQYPELFEMPAVKPLLNTLLSQLANEQVTIMIAA